MICLKMRSINDFFCLLFAERQNIRHEAQILTINLSEVTFYSSFFIAVYYRKILTLQTVHSVLSLAYGKNSRERSATFSVDKYSVRKFMNNILHVVHRSLRDLFFGSIFLILYSTETLCEKTVMVRYFH